MVLSSAIVCDRRSVFPYDRRRSQNILRSAIRDPRSSAIIWKPALIRLHYLQGWIFFLSFHFKAHLCQSMLPTGYCIILPTVILVQVRVTSRESIYMYMFLNFRRTSWMGKYSLKCPLNSNSASHRCRIFRNYLGYLQCLDTKEFLEHNFSCRFISYNAPQPFTFPFIGCLPPSTN